VTLYTNYDEMLKHPGLQAVAIGTATSVHAEETIKHFKGISISIRHDFKQGEARTTSTSVDKGFSQRTAKKKPHLKVMCGFSRRFDDSYRDAYAKMEQGLIGS
jgi:myo-inositol 2-dehydrogenase/D-chiro-inositol 1-dehydrogenase